MKVYVKSDNFKQHPRFRWHPFGTLFDSNGMAEWPDDAFTHRRLRDGDITTEEPKHATQGAHGTHGKPAAKAT